MECNYTKNNIMNNNGEIINNDNKIDNEKYNLITKKELTITVLGNANSGKSSLVGVLTNPLLTNALIQHDNREQIPDNIVPFECLDDGNGKSRENILQHNHEKKTGRTSSITYNHISLNDKIINFVDLAGHESYLKTTISGVTSSYPDFAFICVEKNITRITKEHIRLVYTLDIPFAFIMTKVDIIKEDQLKENLKKLKQMMKSVDKRLYLIKSYNDLEICNPINLAPVFFISSKSNIGLGKLIAYMVNYIESRPQTYLPNAFTIDKVYTVPGFGTVVSGVSGINISKGSDLFIGPFEDLDKKDAFIKVRVRTIHDDYKNFINELEIGQRGCLCINLSGKIDNVRKKIKAGMVLAKNREDINPVKCFKAQISIFMGHATTIKSGYTAYLNSGIIRSGVLFREVSPEYIRSGDKSIVELEFLRNYYCISPGEKFIIREGNTRGVGIIL